MFLLLLYLTPTPSPTEEALDGVVKQADQVLQSFKDLGLFMGILLIVALAFAAVLIVFWGSRNSVSSVLSILTQNNTSKDKEITDLKAQRDQEHQQHMELMEAVKAQFARGNDIQAKQNELLIAINNRGQERDETQAQMAENIQTMVNLGSRPVQDILAHVQRIADIVGRVDVRTADWDTVVKVITPLLTELASLRVEAKKKSTQPIPVIDPLPNPAPTPTDNPS